MKLQLILMYVCIDHMKDIEPLWSYVSVVKLFIQTPEPWLCFTFWCLVIHLSTIQIDIHHTCIEIGYGYRYDRHTSKCMPAITYKQSSASKYKWFKYTSHISILHSWAIECIGYFAVCIIQQIEILYWIFLFLPIPKFLSMDWDASKKIHLKTSIAIN